jgi:hypothetical protein
MGNFDLFVWIQMSNFSTFSKDLLCSIMVRFCRAFCLRHMTIYFQHLLLDQPAYRRLLIKASIFFFIGMRFTTVNEYHQRRPKPKVLNSVPVPPAISVTWGLQRRLTPFQNFLYGGEEGQINKRNISK